MTPDNHDYLTSFPPEILIKILAEVPLSSFLNLMQTSRGLRGFLKANAARICNTAIRARFLIHAKLFKLVLKDGWLVTTHPEIPSCNRVMSEREIIWQDKIYDIDYGA
ncbi:hypothetical protein N431DRAFT_459833 [Stipitochalara longipes BDJ]|nr:hypothetical protein N431DRAFT_459833 [Stipitochalara longipes BDJ]